jgi:hypothetical protein
MRQAGKLIGWAIVLVLTVYGLFCLTSSFLTESHGESAANSISPFVAGMLSSVFNNIKTSLENTPDKKLEENGELIGRKLYPFLKGSLRGFIDSYLKDPQRSEIPNKLNEAGQAASKDVLSPLGEGISQGSRKILQDTGKALDEVRKFRDDNKDIIDSFTSGLKALQDKFRENASPPVQNSPER